MFINTKTETLAVSLGNGDCHQTPSTGADGKTTSDDKTTLDDKSPVEDEPNLEDSIVTLVNQENDIDDIVNTPR